MSRPTPPRKPSFPLVYLFGSTSTVCVMTKLILLLVLAVSSPLAFTACQSAPSERTVAVNTLQAVGLTAKTAMDASTQMLKQGTITVTQWQKVATTYDLRFQPAYATAVLAARSDLSSFASADLIALAAEITNLVATFSK